MKAKKRYEISANGVVRIYITSLTEIDFYRTLDLIYGVNNYTLLSEAYI